MNREEEIRQAALKYAFDTCGGCDCILNAASNDFMAGAEWADLHKGNPWHSVADGDLPKESKGDCNHLPFLVITRNNEIIPTFYKECHGFIDGEWDCEVYVKYWMEIPQLPKESEEKK